MLSSAKTCAQVILPPELLLYELRSRIRESLHSFRVSEVTLPPTGSLRFGTPLCLLARTIAYTTDALFKLNYRHERQAIIRKEVT